MIHSKQLTDTSFFGVSDEVVRTGASETTFCVDALRRRTARKRIERTLIDIATFRSDAIGNLLESRLALTEIASLGVNANGVTSARSSTKTFISVNAISSVGTHLSQTERVG